MSILLLVMNIRRGNRIGSITAAQKSLYSTNRIITRIQLVTSLRTSRYNGDVTSSRIGLGRPVSRLLSTSTTTSNFYNDSEEDIKLLLKEWGQPAFRAQQIHSWVFEKGVTDFDDMLDLPKDLRSKLKLFYAVGSLKLISEQVSKDGTRKRAYELKDGQIIESVLMPYDDGRRTACISSQAGCGMGCVFCATGEWCGEAFCVRTYNDVVNWWLRHIRLMQSLHCHWHVIDHPSITCDRSPQCCIYMYSPR